jgi:biotin carboxyl carrier protein
MRVDVLTLFTAMFAGPLNESILKRAQADGRLAAHIHDIRAYATDKHRTCDDTPFGGGAGMVMKLAPLADAIEQVTAAAPEAPHVIYLTPDGTTLTQAIAQELRSKPRLMLICGHYEGIDERVRERYIVYAPMHGNLRRLKVHPGDAVSRRGDPIVILDPSDSELLDPKTKLVAIMMVQTPGQSRTGDFETAVMQAVSP